MKLRLFALSFCTVLPMALFAAQPEKAGSDCCKNLENCSTETEARADAKPAPQTHPLKGVVVNVLAEKSALVVKHEEIPGVMRAMTMMFLVDAETLGRVKKGDAITAQLGRNENNKWILRDVKVVAKE